MSVKFHKAIKTRHSELDSESHITVNQERIMRPWNKFRVTQLLYGKKRTIKN